MSLDFLALYHAWHELDNGARAQLRRVAAPDELKDIPVFYRLVKPFNWTEPRQQHALIRMVFCLTAGNNAITHQPSEQGKAAKSLGRCWRRVKRSMSAEFTSSFVRKAPMT